MAVSGPSKQLIHDRQVRTNFVIPHRLSVVTYPQEDPSSGWWEPLVKDAESENAKHRSAIAEDPNVCWDGVIASVEQIVVTTATIH